MKDKPIIITKKIALDHEVLRQMDRIIDGWRAPIGAEPNERKCYTQDRKDLRRIQTLYKKGKWKEAMLYADSLDTLVREMIPDKIWDDIHSDEFQ